MELVFFSCFIMYIIVDVCAFIKVGKLKSEIEYERSTTRLFCIIQKNIFSLQPPQHLKADSSKSLYKGCVYWVRGVIGISAVFMATCLFLLYK
jgi:hypothetical protein